MTDDIKIYHVETQKDYNDLMIKLENEGYTWFSGKNPTDLNTWVGEETVIYLDYCGKHTMSYGLMSTLIEYNPNANIIKHKAEGERRMGKVIVPQYVADWYEENKNFTMYGLLKLFEVGAKSEQLVCWSEEIGKCEAQRVIAKMHLYKDYEVEEEKKYYWCKKKESLLEFETVDFTYLNYNHITERLFFSGLTQNKNHKTKFTEIEVRELVSEEDFNKLEKVEITE